MAAKKNPETLEVLEINTGKVEFFVLGKTPFIANSMSNKALHEFLLPKGKKTSAEKAHSLKHDPRQEFRDSPYVNADPKAATYIEHLATAFKQAIRGAGVDVPGSSKAQMGRLMWVESERVPIYGKPQIFMAVTRSSDQKQTPDIRTRCIIPEWACKITVSFVQPILTYKTVGNLLAAAGLIQGVGDWRPQKGSGNYGQFELVDAKNKDFNRIIKFGHAQQLKAMQDPEAYDHETEKLLAWFDSEIDRRGVKLVKLKSI